MQKHTRHVLGLAAALALATGCDDPQGGRGRGAPSTAGKGDCTGWYCEEEEGLPTGPLEEAFCEIEVLGEGSVPTETEYLANVIWCEHGDADIESLKAMAIAARSVAYWEMGVNGDICDDDHCQVFTCAGEPSAKHYRAVEETSGMYLFWGDEVTYGFYVQGRETTPNSLCEPIATEEWVTDNLGRTGDDVEQTELGWVSDPSDAVYGQNRGCMSQLGAQCLATELDYDYEDILRYYYGADIQIGQAQGECVKAIEEDPDPDPDPEPEATSGSESGSTSGDPDPGTASASDSDPNPDSDSASGSDTDGDAETDSGSDSDGRPPRPSDSDSDADTASASDTAADSDTDTAPADSDTDGDTDAAADTEANDTESNDSSSNDTDDGSDPWDDSNGGDWPDDDYEPGGEPTPWGDDGGSDTDTDTDGGADSQRSGCSVSGAGGGEPPAFALGLLLLGLMGRRKRGPARH